MISIIIPTYNEADNIGRMVAGLIQIQMTNREIISEIVVVDGGSNDETIRQAEKAGARVILSAAKGRAVQMNTGAWASQGKILYFLHADSYPPPRFPRQIVEQVERGYSSGCYRLQFDYPHWFLRFNNWFTRFNLNAVRFGDQSLFVTREVFQKAGGYNETLLMVEDQEIIARLRRYGRFTVMKGSVTTSARRYLQNGIYRTQAIFFLIYSLYRLGCSQQKLLKLYRKLIRQSKI